MIRRQPERGNAMLVTMIIVSALLAGAAVVVSMQVQATRASGVTKQGLEALYCAEAGLAAAHSTVANNYSLWGTTIAADPNGAAEPTWLQTAFSHDLDGDGVNDYTVTLKDNDDEVAPAANDLTKDVDTQIFIISTCTKYPDTPKQVVELVKYAGGGTCYKSQQGGCNGNGNDN
jgi:type II secretory pathway pseudopilin PulG